MGHFGVGLPESLMSHFRVTLLLSVFLCRDWSTLTSHIRLTSQFSHREGCFIFVFLPPVFKHRVAQEPNRNRKTGNRRNRVFPKPKVEPEPPEPFSRNRNRNRPFLLNCTEIQEKPFLQRKPPEPKNRNRSKPFHHRTVTEPNRSKPCKQPNWFAWKEDLKAPWSSFL